MDFGYSKIVRIAYNWTLRYSWHGISILVTVICWLVHDPKYAFIFGMKM